MMNRWLTVTFGIGLIFLWMAGVSASHTSDWLAWLDLVLGLGALVIAGAMDSESPRSRQVGGPVFLSIALFALSALGFLSTPPVWLVLWNLVIGFGFLVLAFVALSEMKSVRRSEAARRARPPRKVA